MAGSQLCCAVDNCLYGYLCIDYILFVVFSWHIVLKRLNSYLTCQNGSTYIMHELLISPYENQNISSYPRKSPLIFLYFVLNLIPKMISWFIFADSKGLLTYSIRKSTEFLQIKIKTRFLKFWNRKNWPNLAKNWFRISPKLKFHGKEYPLI